jgi:lipoate-protein ligase A
MIRKTRIYREAAHDPYRNIALEEWFLDNVESETCILYLWQNRETVVVGRNQNCYKECRVRELEDAGGHLARRLSGGGAVFHDLGNLNFTFLVRKEDYDLSRQLNVILGAVTSLGIEAKASGRNDLLVDGRKFSGNAFYTVGRSAYHHGTILVDADTEKAAEYLGTPSGKFTAKSIPSVRSPIANLREFRPDLSVEEVVGALSLSFDHTFGLWSRPVSSGDIDWADVERRRDRFASPEWKYNRSLAFQYEFSRRFPWGETEFFLGVKNGIVEDIEINSDAMNGSLILDVSAAIRGSIFSARGIAGRVRELSAAYDGSDSAVVQDISDFIGEQNF